MEEIIETTTGIPLFLLFLCEVLCTATASEDFAIWLRVELPPRHTGLKTKQKGAGSESRKWFGAHVGIGDWLPSFNRCPVQCISLGRELAEHRQHRSSLSLHFPAAWLGLTVQLCRATQGSQVTLRLPSPPSLVYSSSLAMAPRSWDSSEQSGRNTLRWHALRTI